MRKIKSINVFGEKIPIIYKAFLDNPLTVGLYYIDKKEIHISTSQNNENIAKTTLHETIHALLFRLGWQQVLTTNEQELICEHFSHFIYENFKPK